MSLKVETTRPRRTTAAAARGNILAHQKMHVIMNIFRKPFTSGKLYKHTFFLFNAIQHKCWRSVGHLVLQPVVFIRCVWKVEKGEKIPWLDRPRYQNNHVTSCLHYTLDQCRKLVIYIMATEMVSCSSEWKHCVAVDWIWEMVCLKQIWQLDVVPSQVCWWCGSQTAEQYSKVILVDCGIFFDMYWSIIQISL